MRSFASDNNSGVDARVMAALEVANQNHAVGYGDDPWTAQAVADLKTAFEAPDMLPLFVFNGTGSNVVGLDLVTRPYHAILCAETAHIHVDECGAPVRFTGCQLRPIATNDGKLTPELVCPYLQHFGVVHHSQPGALYISQATELGTIYTPDEIRALTDLAHAHGMRVHMDGARLANACVALNCSLADLTTHTGVDTVSFGGTKNGLMMGESVLVFDKTLQAEAGFVRKQAAQLASKMRYLSVQFSAYLKNDLWYENAQKANMQAKRLADGLQALGLSLTQKLETNQLFLQLPKEAINALLNDYFFYVWNETTSEVRFVTSWDTTPEDVDALLRTLKSLL